jgi:hypothetical protein
LSFGRPASARERARAETESFLGGLLDENPIAINELVISRLMPASTN